MESKGGFSLNKYHAKKTVVDGITFDSKAEANRFCELRLLEKSGKIKNLQRQKKYILVQKSMYGREISYRADFVYTEGDRKIVEDVKGVRTPVYKLKRRLMAEIYGIVIREVS